jgi:CO dehydrogenase maturation factor
MIIAVIGKGGVGKTTVTALLLRRLLDAGETPVLAVDADPSNCLGPALGLTITRTLAELRDDLREGDTRSESPGVRKSEGRSGGRPPSMAKSDWLALEAEDAIVEQAGFDLLTMGHSEGPGCYCFVNNLIRSHLDRLARNYRHVLVDCEAGLEHLSRRTSGRPDRLVCVANGSRMSRETIRRALELYQGLNGTLPRVDLVVNGRVGQVGPFDSLALAQGRQAEGAGMFSSVIHVPWDQAIADLDAAGKSLLQIDAASPALTAISSWNLPSTSTPASPPR